jgi:hypothetical protein
MDPKRPEWQRAFEWASWSQRIELGFVRGAVALLIPVVAYFYSPRLALVVLGIPCGYAFYFYLSRAIRRFLKREP